MKKQHSIRRLQFKAEEGMFVQWLIDPHVSIDYFPYSILYSITVLVVLITAFTAVKVLCSLFLQKATFKGFNVRATLIQVFIVVPLLYCSFGTLCCVHGILLILEVRCLVKCC